MSDHRYDSAFYVQVLDRYVQTGECAETDSEPLYAYPLSVMNDPLMKIQVLNDEICARIFYDTMIQFVQLNLEKEKYHLQKSRSGQQAMKLVLEWSVTKRKDGRQALMQQIADDYQAYGFDHRFYRSQFDNEGKVADVDFREKMVDDWEEAFRRKQQSSKSRR